MGQPRILTFNFHEPYLCLMAKTGLRFDAGLYESGPLAREWNPYYRPKPPGVTFLEERQWRENLRAGHYDVVVAQNEMNALDVVKAGVPVILVCHNRRTFLSTTATVDEGDPIALFAKLIERLERYCEFVFISESKRSDYGVPGRVIRPGIDLDECCGYTGEEAHVLRVGNMMAERNLMFDVPFQQEVCRGLPNKVLGTNPTIPEAAPARSYEDLIAFYRSGRCLLHVTRQEFEDGYNLSMLEAMACGMPVVSLANPTSPITDGVDGFTSYDPVILHQRLRQLLGDLDLAREIGARGRQTIAEKFSLSAFAENWRSAIFEAAERRPRSKWRPRPRPTHRPKVLLHYLMSPLTTGRYFEQSLLPGHDVITAGMRLPEDVLRLWGFEGEPPPYPPHRLDLPHRASYQELLAKMPRDFNPSLYWWIDSGVSQVEPDIGLLSMPRIAYLIDTHVAPELRIEMARHFDYTFLAQKGQIETFRQAGIENLSWVPLACYPPLHQIGPLERIYDTAYVGSFSTEEGARRRDLLQAIRERFPNSKMGRYWPTAMARLYAQSRIVVNACHNRDVNMRVFEAMASGALLITDEADGLEDLFEDGVHLVVYRNDEEVFGLIERYLQDDEARERIARAGQELVLREHTYAHRTQEILRRAGEFLGRAPQHRRSQKPKEAYYYESVRREVIQHVPLQARRVLDIGCGAGALGHVLKEERGVQEVVGVEIIEEAWRQAKEVLDEALLGDIEEMELPFDDGYFDCIVCADVIEHLVQPTETLRKLSRFLAEEGVVFFSVPNIRFYEAIDMLSRGAWTYQDTGICDSTHLRFFTRAELIQMVEEAGFEVAEIGPLHIMDAAGCPRGADGSVTMGKLTLADVSDAEYEELRAFQYAVIACKPGLDRLRRAREALEAGEDRAAYGLAFDAVGVDEAERRRIMAKALARLGELQEAQQEYLKALEIRSTPEIAGEYGILLLTMSQTRKAKRYLNEALRAHPPNQDRIEGALGLVALSEQHFEEAYSFLASALDAGFEHTALLKPFTEVATAVGRLEEAEPVLRRFVDFYPGDLELACDHAQVLATLQRRDEARQRLKEVLVLTPGHARARQMLETWAQEDT